jgi:hypothetical protein
MPTDVMPQLIMKIPTLASSRIARGASGMIGAEAVAKSAPAKDFAPVALRQGGIKKSAGLKAE